MMLPHSSGALGALGAPRMSGVIVALVLSLMGFASDESAPEAVDDAAAVEASAPRAPLTMPRGEGLHPLIVPDGEVLVFEAFVDLGLEAKAGTVTLSAGSEPFSAGLPTPGARVESDGLRTAWIESRAQGAHLGYKLDHTVHTRILPTEWPRYFHKDLQQGSENRKRELKIGVRDGQPMAWARANSHCGGCQRREHFVESHLPWGDDFHCKKCKRMEHRDWRPAVEREVPEGTVDLLAAIYLSRTLLLEDIDSLTFPMLTRLDLWEVTLSQGEEKKKKTPAGEFICREIKLSTTIPEGENSDKEFKGLFGMHGTIHIWLERESGIPVLINGRVPIGPLDLGVSVKLLSYEGTPETFGPRD